MGDVALLFILIFSLTINVMIDDVSLEVGLAATEKGDCEWTTLRQRVDSGSRIL